LALEKASIEYTVKGRNEAVEVLFNPTEYRLAKANVFSEVAVPGLQSPPLQFVRGNPRTLSMQLFFDTYETGDDVRNHTSMVTGLLDIEKELHAPPVCRFVWGRLAFKGVLERADVRFTLFYPDGIPARATMDVSFKEALSAAEQGRLNSSADFTRRYVVKQGDTLSGIAGREYGNPAMWRVIAEKNRIDDPLAIMPGQFLTLPAV
jgi:hypothetical protein